MQEAEVGPGRGLRGVFVRRIGAPTEPSPPGPARLESRRGAFEPRVLGLEPGRRLEWRNADFPDVHHFAYSGRARPDGAGFRSGPPPGDAVLIFDEEGPGQATRCAVHPREVAWVCVAAGGSWALSGPDGAFELPALPPGRRVLEFWHEACETRRVDVEIPGPVDVEIRLKPR